MKRILKSVIISIFAVLACNMACFAEDAAMVMDIRKGRVYYDTGKNKGAEVILTDYLSPGQGVRLESGAVLVLIYFTSGVREEITGPGNIIIRTTQSEKQGKVKLSRSKLECLPPKAIVGVRDVQQTGAELLRKGEQVETGIPKIMALSLLDTDIRSVPPVFRWLHVKGVDFYEIVIYDDLGKSFRYRTRKNSFRYTKSGSEPGDGYNWTLTARSQGKTLAKANGEFTIIEKESLKQVNLAEKKIRKRFSKNSDELLISLASLYQDYNLKDEAGDIVLKLYKKYPENKNFKAWNRILNPWPVKTGKSEDHSSLKKDVRHSENSRKSGAATCFISTAAR